MSHEVETLRARVAELEEHAQELDVVYRFSRLLLVSTDIDEILWDVANEAVARLGLEDCVIYLVEDGALVQRAAFGPKNPRGREIAAPIRIAVGSGIVGTVAATGVTERISDTRQHPRYILDDQARLAELAIPIIHEGRVIGVLDSEHSQLGFFTERHEAILTTIASMTAARIARALLDAELRALNRDLERKVHERTLALAEAHRQSEALLLNVLPASIAERLKQGESRIADRFEDVTVLFADIVGFTRLSATNSPEHVVGILERMFSEFDTLTAAAGAEKIKTVGDAYMVVCGVPTARPDHCRVLATLALEMLDAVRRISVELGIALTVRIGLHSGPVVAGILGTRKFAYDLWGDTVNTASRLESHGVPGRIQIGEALVARLAGFRLRERGEIDVKGLGRMRTWFLEGNQLAASTVPTE
jgi:class 3 adenylate cyclase/putative methionine-R-sulfoxide reductase with GAF domain